jgi:hypothetical protein
MLASHLTSVRSSRGVVPSPGWTPPAPHGTKAFPNCGQENHTLVYLSKCVLKLNLKNTVRALLVLILITAGSDPLLFSPCARSRPQDAKATQSRAHRCGERCRSPLRSQCASASAA